MPVPHHHIVATPPPFDKPPYPANLFAGAPARDGIRVNCILTRETGEMLGNLAAYLVSDYASYAPGAVTGSDLDD